MPNDDFDSTDHQRPRRNRGAAKKRTRSSGGGGQSFLRAPSLFDLVGCVALLVGLIAIACTFFLGPLGRGMKGYSFSSPENSLRSSMKITINGDMLARHELGLIRTKEKREELEEQLDTLEIHETSEYKDYKILFVSYEENSLKKYHTFIFEKSDDTAGYWLPAAKFNIRDNDLKKAMSDWEAKKSEVKEKDD